MNVSRGLGDLAVYKANPLLGTHEQLVSSLPDVYMYEYTSKFWFLLASDGLWDVLKSDEVIGIISPALEENDYPENICKTLINLCLRKGATDNVTCILVHTNGWELSDSKLWISV